MTCNDKNCDCEHNHEEPEALPSCDAWKQGPNIRPLGPTELYMVDVYDYAKDHDSGKLEKVFIARGYVLQWGQDSDGSSTFPVAVVMLKGGYNEGVIKSVYVENVKIIGTVRGAGV